tara:strand:- start:489 stop:857 length:369 start_codon:yes stop_codon:yes gene_type:complete
MDNNKIHYFDVEIANKLGVDCSIMLNHIIYWIATNDANTRNYINGRTWTYCSIVDFKQYFSYWSTSQIRRIINTLIKKEILLVSNFNKHKYDRTNWYALNDEKYWLTNYNPIDKIDKWKNKY